MLSNYTVTILLTGIFLFFPTLLAEQKSDSNSDNSVKNSVKSTIEPAQKKAVHIEPESQPKERGPDKGPRFRKGKRKRFFKEWSNKKGFTEQRKNRKKRMMEELGLNPDQKKKLDLIKSKHRENIDTMHKEMKKLRQQFHDGLTQKVYNEKTLKQLSASIAQLTQKKMDKRIEHIKEVRQLLTPEQFEKLNKFVRKGRHGRRKGRGNNRRKGFRKPFKNDQ